MLLYAGMLEDGADFYIADCPFSDFKEQLAYRLKTEMKLPAKLFLPVADLFLRMREKYSIADVSPISVIENIKKPILFIHSEKDDFILPTMSEALYEKKQGPKNFTLLPMGSMPNPLTKTERIMKKSLTSFWSSMSAAKILYHNRSSWLQCKPAASYKIF